MPATAATADAPQIASTDAETDIHRAPVWIRQDRAARMVGISERTLGRWITLGYVIASYPGGAGVVSETYTDRRTGERRQRRRRAPGIVLVQRDSLIAYIEGCVQRPATARTAK